MAFLTNTLWIVASNVAFVCFVAYLLFQWRRQSSGNTITLEMSGLVRERIITLGAQTGLTRIEVFRHALSTYEYTVQQRLDGATFYRNQTPMSWRDEVPDNIPEDAPETVVIREPEPEPEEEYEDDRRTAWDRIR